MDLSNLLAPNLITLVYALYFIGTYIKGLSEKNDKFIPLELALLGILCALGLLGISVDSVIQGILCAAGAVFTDQCIKQNRKKLE